MNIEEQIGKPEGLHLEYKAVLPSPKSLANLIAAFANTDGGIIILGVSQLQGKPEVVGISREFNISGILHKALGYLLPKPSIVDKFDTVNGKDIFYVQVEKSSESISTVDGKIYARRGNQVILTNSQATVNKSVSTVALRVKTFVLDKNTGTQSVKDFRNHLISIVDIIDNLFDNYFPSKLEEFPKNDKGKVLLRILFSSCADNFEVYMSNILHEIYLSNPNVLKSEENVTIKEVLNCHDLQDFVEYWARKKIGKLQKGSVKGFINENKQIKSLNVFTKDDITELEKILQIRHLFTHSNGIVDEKFRKYFRHYYVNDLFELTLEDFLLYVKKLVDTVNKIDEACVIKFNL